MESTHRLGLPLLNPGQAQKELFHNEALQLIDVVLAGAVEEGPRAAPPAEPAIGQCFIVGQQPTGDWAGYADHVAAFTAGGWRYLAPVEGMTFQVRDERSTATYSGGNWETGVLRASALHIGGQQVIGPRLGAIAAPAGGALIDSEARIAVNAILAAMRAHGLIGQ